MADKVTTISILSGALIRRELARRRLTQRQLAADLGLREATISNAIRGHPMSAAVIYKIALGLTMADVRARGA